MPENYALYTTQYEALPEQNMRSLVPGIEPTIAHTERGLTYSYAWPDLTAVVSAMPELEIASHLSGFVGYVGQAIYANSVPPRGQALIARILCTTLVVGVEFAPGRDAEGRAEAFLATLCGGLTPLVFFQSAIYDARARLLLGPDASFDPNARLE